MFSLFCTKIDQ